MPDVLINTVSQPPFMVRGEDEPLFLEQRGLAETLLPTLQGLLTDKDQGIIRQGTIRIVRGPGSFTGIRIGLAVGVALKLSGWQVQGVNAFDALRACWFRLHQQVIPPDQPMILPFYKDQVFLSYGGDAPEVMETTNHPPAHSFSGPLLPVDYAQALAAPLTPLYGRASYVGV